MKYYVDVIKTNKYNATMKAPSDIAKICDDLGMKAFTMPNIPYGKNVIYQKLWMMLVWNYNWKKLLNTMKSGDVLVYQHPMYGTKIMQKILPKFRKKGIKIVMLIHDLNLLRGGENRQYDKNSSIYVQDIVILGYADKIICHNKRMEKYLIDQGFSANKLVSLEIFDYLSDFAPNKQSVSGKWTCVIAGNLVRAKCKYIYDLMDSLEEQGEYLLHLYGGGLEISSEELQKKKNVIYHGAVSPEELPKILEGDFGIVWDGTSIESCEGDNGYYLRYNNPHKTSLFLASGKPIIVWKESAMADFVQKYQVGIVVNSLRELQQILADLTVEDYFKILDNVAIVGQKLREGYYFKTAYQQAEEDL